MKMYLLSDNHDTLTGMRLCGIEGCIVRTKEELLKKLALSLEDRSLAVLLITDKLVEMAPDYIDELKQTVRTPLFVSVPDRHGSRKKADFITSYVRDAVGIKM